jgi:hypothetical protein
VQLFVGANKGWVDKLVACVDATLGFVRREKLLPASTGAVTRVKLASDDAAGTAAGKVSTLAHLALLLQVAAAPLPCEYWLVEESDAGDYSQLDVRVLGFQTNRSVCTNADDSGAGKSTSLPQFLAINRSQLTRLITQHLLPKVRGGAATTDIVILDLESPRGIHPRGYGELNDTMLAAVVRATRLRLQVARALMPHAGIALYGTAVNSSAGAVLGYKRAAALGLWDDVTHLVPVLYTGEPQATPVPVMCPPQSLANTHRPPRCRPWHAWRWTGRVGGVASDRVHPDRADGRPRAAARPSAVVADVRRWTAS